MAALTPSYAGISYERIDKVGLQWPCPTKDHPGTAFLHEGRFTRGKGLFHAIAFRPPAEVPDEEYPFMLSTGRTLYNYNVGNMTRKSAAISQKEGENFVEMHADDAERLGHRRRRLRARDHAPRHRWWSAPAWPTRCGPARSGCPSTSSRASTNQLTNDAFDNVTRTAEYKCCAAKVEKAESPDA